MACRQRDEWFALTTEQSIAADDECFGSLFDDGRKCLFKVNSGAGMYDPELSPDHARCIQHFISLACLGRIIRVDEHGDGRCLGHQFAKQFQPLRT